MCAQDAVMRLGLQVSYFSWPEAPDSIGPTFGRIARNAEEAGLVSLWVMDHFFQIGTIGPPELDMLEGYTALAFAAGQTSRIELGTLVTGVTYRHPGLLAKTVTTLDVLSGGRAWLGIRAAWNEWEHRGLGVPFPSTGERFERLEEALQICLQMWEGDDSPYAGKHYQLDRPLNVPQSLRRPHPPILIGGGGEKKTLRLVAQYADACNLFDLGLGPEGIPRKLDIIRRHCEEVGRDYDEIEKTCLAAVSLSRSGRGESSSRAPLQTVDHVVERFGRLSEAGIDTVIVGLGDDTDDAAYELVAEVVRQVEPLAAAGR
jgi:F420-dependent oxidoreductase-like protein